MFSIQRKTYKNEWGKNQNVGEKGYKEHKIYEDSNEEKQNREKGKRKGKIWIFLKNKA